MSFTLQKGRTFGLVGESGCGKSSCARTIIRIYEPTGGKILLDGQDISHMKSRQLQLLRRKMQMIFQDPYASLNARMTVRDIIAEPLLAHHVAKSRQEIDEYVYPMLERVGLTREHAGRYAHEFSGGSGSGWALPARWCSSRSWSSATSPSRRWTCPSRRRWSTCCGLPAGGGHLLPVHRP